MTDVKRNRILELHGRSASRLEFSQQLRPLAAKGLTLQEMRQATSLLRDFDEPAEPLRITLLGSYTVELLRDYVIFHGLLHGYETELHVSPYGQVIQELQAGTAGRGNDNDFTCLLLQWSDMVPALGEPLHSLSPEDRKKVIDSLRKSVSDMLRVAQKNVRGNIVLSFLPFMTQPGLGLYDSMSEASELSFLTTAKKNLAAMITKDFPSVHFDDGDHLLNALGMEGLFDYRLWYSSRFPFSDGGTHLFVQRLFRFPVLMRGPGVKCIVLDCDNTLWGGVIGEDGMTGIRLGPEYPGSCYVDFQRRLLDFLHRGFLLAICSKNNSDDVREVLREHPHMVIREEHLAATRVNWQPKPENLRSMADELRLGLDSFLLVDDSPHEGRMVRKYAPEVRTALVPERPMDVPQCLDHLQELEILSFTEEDAGRYRMYVQNRQRVEMSVSCGDISEYLESLRMAMRVSFDDIANVPRLAQMTQKTNQFNLTTKRYQESDIKKFIEDPSWLVAHFSLSDIFGDNGIVGLALLSLEKKGVAVMDTFLMSCRVIGRRAEEAFLHSVLTDLRARGVREVTSTYRPTRKNGLVMNFWEEQGFSRTGEGEYKYVLAELPDAHPASDYFNVQICEDRK